ncbi:hypothetical protein ABZ478_02035 [Streptomyces sp. NPDC005706]|uniref:hypothetical protein n=1 Tax=Streptomyces sp. NPDC005706 TaxID=3157169 RepID=UPI0033FFC4E2
MFNAQKIATVTGLVGSLAVLCLGAGQASAGGLPSGCGSAAESGAVCVQKNDSHVDKDGTHVIQQNQGCSSVDRPNVMFPADEASGKGSVSTGQDIDCSNKAELPKGFKKPHVDF